MKRKFIIAVSLTLMIATNGQAQSYSYKVKYGMIYAGSARIEYHVDDGALQTSLNIHSSPWLSTLWSLSDSISSYFELESDKLRTHDKAIHEGSYHRKYQVSFSDSNSIEINGKIKTVDTQGLIDVPSLIYKLSQSSFTHGDTLSFKLWDGRSFGTLSLLVEKPGKASLLKPFSVKGWKLRPLNSSKKSRENRVQLALLLSEDSPHVPLRIEIDTKYGDIIMKLE